MQLKLSIEKIRENIIVLIGEAKTGCNKTEKEREIEGRIEALCINQDSVENRHFGIISGAISDSITVLASCMDMNKASDPIKTVLSILIEAAKRTGKQPPSWYRSKYEKECWEKKLCDDGA